MSQWRVLCYCKCVLKFEGRNEVGGRAYLCVVLGVSAIEDTEDTGERDIRLVERVCTSVQPGILNESVLHFRSRGLWVCEGGLRFRFVYKWNLYLTSQ